MKEDELAAKLVEAHARTDTSSRMEGPLWEKLAAGALSDEERSVLAAQVAGDAELEAAFHLLAGLAEDRGAREAAVLARVAAKPERPARVITMRRASMITGALALAAGLALLVTRPGGTGGVVLPSYEIEATGGEQEVRAVGGSSSPAVLRLGPDARLSIHLRPDQPASSPVEVRAFLVRDQTATPWSPPVKISPSGAVQIEGPASSLVPGANGPVDAIVGVGPAGWRPTGLDALQHGAYPVFRVHLEITGR